MKFLTTGEKLRRLRTQLGLKQDDLRSENVTRGLISMMETDKRDVTYATALKLAERFNERAEELDIIMNVDEAYLMRSPKEDAELYCLRRLKDTNIKMDIIDGIFQIVNEYNLIEVKVEAYCRLGEIYFKEREFQVACDIYKKAREICIGIKKNEKLGYIYWKMGVCKADDLKYDTAIEYYQLSQYYCSQYNDFKTKKLCLYSMAMCYRRLNQIEVALETIERFLSVCDEKEDFRLYFFAHNTKGTCYNAIGEYDKAIEVYKFLLTKILDDKSAFLGYIYSNMGSNYCAKNDFKESIKYFNMAEKTIREVNKPILAATLIEKSEVLLKQDLNTKAIEAIELGLKYAEEYNDLEYLLKGNYLLTKIYDKMNDTEKLEKVYFEIIDLLKSTKSNEMIKSIYDELALMYLNEDKTDLCKKYLLLSKNLDWGCSYEK
ncbi:Tetratricopeptide repeat-containing protein [Clostridium acidisoli DSM 12555]|uniref:Tetratricopeptide repeat-containing protein n=1 Tax=Clostridium acidisoli DSM 12555 TaxID=1121291 RepID=A0A1W1Y0D3_9CLOT|nr:helix-turn-helix transcriptional regulator [Clostridium acidisoli]SMC29585.1 Tetratricopeptide repeat-containing protein [Clostridium acidisoli DSM 12555]